MPILETRAAKLTEKIAKYAPTRRSFLQADHVTRGLPTVCIMGNFACDWGGAEVLGVFNSVGWMVEWWGQ